MNCLLLICVSLLAAVSGEQWVLWINGYRQTLPELVCESSEESSEEGFTALERAKRQTKPEQVVQKHPGLPVDPHPEAKHPAPLSPPQHKQPEVPISGSDNHEGHRKALLGGDMHLGSKLSFGADLKKEVSQKAAFKHSSSSKTDQEISHDSSHHSSAHFSGGFAAGGKGQWGATGSMAEKVGSGITNSMHVAGEVSKGTKGQIEGAVKTGGAVAGSFTGKGGLGMEKEMHGAGKVSKGAEGQIGGTVKAGGAVAGSMAEKIGSGMESAVGFGKAVKTKAEEGVKAGESTVVSGMETVKSKIGGGVKGSSYLGMEGHAGLGGGISSATKIGGSGGGKGKLEAAAEKSSKIEGEVKNGFGADASMGGGVMGSFKDHKSIAGDVSSKLKGEGKDSLNLAKSMGGETSSNLDAGINGGMKLAQSAGSEAKMGSSVKGDVEGKGQMGGKTGAAAMIKNGVKAAQSSSSKASSNLVSHGGTEFAGPGLNLGGKAGAKSVEKLHAGQSSSTHVVHGLAEKSTDVLGKQVAGLI